MTGRPTGYAPAMPDIHQPTSPEDEGVDDANEVSDDDFDRALGEAPDAEGPALRDVDLDADEALGPG